MEKGEGLLDALEWLGHAGFHLTVDGRDIYLDPFRIAGKRLPPADAIFITHPHYDHWSPDDVRQLLTPDTILVAPKECRGVLDHELLTIQPGEERGIRNWTARAVPAYNLDKPYHRRENGWVGYILGFGVKGKLFHAGDTDAIPELRDLDCAIALLPVGGTYTMNAEEAAAAANDLKATVVVPMHYGSIVGTEDDARRFASLVVGKTVHRFALH